MNRKSFNVCKPLTIVCLTLAFASFTFSQVKESDYKLTAVSFVNGYDLEARQSTDLWKQFRLFRYLAPAAVIAGEPEKAQSYANELTAVANKIQSESHLKNFVLSCVDVDDAAHTSNIVLGRIAFEAGDIDKAKEHLLAAGRIKGNVPTLMSFGPDMSLAKQLIEKGERETAIQYFDLCANFWKNDKGKLEKWKAIVKEGGMPDFGSNLSYVFDGWRYF